MSICSFLSIAFPFLFSASEYIFVHYHGLAL
uniref:Uncharacterized protein n=1 Tax=Rhizophora mucronata TaxID=61149 RepID=A0A2P2PRA6_RHIMU